MDKYPSLLFRNLIRFCNPQRKHLYNQEKSKVEASAPTRVPAKPSVKKYCKELVLYF